MTSPRNAGWNVRRQAPAHITARGNWNLAAWIYLLLGAPPVAMVGYLIWHGML